MPEFISRFQQQIMEFWKNLDKSQKIRIGVTSAIIVVAVAVGIFLMTRPTYTTIINGADSKDIGEMKKVLEDKGISYKLTDDGTGIMVNQKDSNNAHVELATAGFPKGGMTFADALGSIKINTTESDKKHIWKNLDESDIRRMLMQLETIKEANVKITQPDKSLFEEAAKPSAAISITPRGEGLTPKQIDGIVMLVAKSVEGLDPKEIIVTDDKGNPLNGDMGDDIATQTATQYDMKLKQKKDLEKSIKELLGGSFKGFDNIRVVVNPVIDFNQEKSQSKVLTNPNGGDTGAVLTRDEKNEEVKNGTTGGAPGTDTNPGTNTTPSYPNGTSGNGSYKNSELSETFGYNETKTETTKSVGEIVPEKTTATVTLLYGARVTDGSLMDEQFMQNAQAMIANAIGVPAKNIFVNKMEIAAATPEAKSLNDTIKEMLNTYGIPALLLLMVIVLLLSMIPKKKKADKPLEQLAMEGGMTLDQSAISGPRFVVPDASGDNVPEIELEERSEVKKQIDKFVKQKPEAVAQLLRNWLSDEWD